MLAADQAQGRGKYRSATIIDGTIGLTLEFLFILRANDRADRIDNSLVRWISVPSRGHHRLQNLLNFPPFWFLDPASGSHGWLKQKSIFFLGKRIVMLLPAAPIKLSATEHITSHHFSLLPSHLFLLLCFSLHRFRCALHG
jgi:hypothetical protein